MDLTYININILACIDNDQSTNQQCKEPSKDNWHFVVIYCMHIDILTCKCVSWVLRGRKSVKSLGRLVPQKKIIFFSDYAK